VSIQISGHTEIAAVIGSPVRHSLSPLLYNTAFDELGLDWRFVAFEVAPGRVGRALEAMRTFGLRGLSVTMPHKDDVARLVDHPSDAVRRLAACNCVMRRDDDTLEGHNTDGDGLLDSINEQTDFTATGRRVVVLGAGGAARSIVEAVGRAGAADIAVVNRSADKAAVAAALSPNARVGSEADIDNADLVVNATSVGMGDSTELPFSASRLRPDLLVSDIVYKPLVTPLLAEAARRGATPIDGLGMLVHQAARQLHIWTGLSAPIEAMTSAARAAVA
jgi:shikimate dehydrogenase